MSLKWVTSAGNRTLSGPYAIYRTTLGFEVWIQSRERYALLQRDVPTLIQAKEFCEAHHECERIPRPANEGEGEVS